MGGSIFKGGRNHFQDVENGGRVGAAWGIPGFYSEDNQDIVLGIHYTRKAYIGDHHNFMTVHGNGNVDIAGRLKVNGKLDAPNIRWEDITSDRAPFNLDCEYRWKGTGNIMYYATAVRGDHIWCDFSGGNYEGVDSHNKALSKGDRGTSPTHTFRRCP